MQSALHSLDRCGLSRSRRPARISQQPGGASRQTGVDQYDRRSAAVASRRAKTAFRKHLARHTPLTQRAAICCAQMRLSGAPHASHLSLPARDLGFGKAPAPIQEFLARMIAAHAFHWARLTGYIRGNIETIEVPGRGRLRLEGLDAAPNACVDLPFLLAV
jgi:hypothetical protein